MCANVQREYSCEICFQDLNIIGVMLREETWQNELKGVFNFYVLAEIVFHKLLDNLDNCFWMIYSIISRYFLVFHVFFFQFSDMPQDDLPAAIQAAKAAIAWRKDREGTTILWIKRNWNRGNLWNIFIFFGWILIFQLIYRFLNDGKEGHITIFLGGTLVDEYQHTSVQHCTFFWTRLFWGKMTNSRVLDNFPFPNIGLVQEVFRNLEGVWVVFQH